MKKYILTFLIVIFFVLGCSKNPNIDNLKEIIGYEYDSTIICQAFNEKIKYFNFDNVNNYLVTENNDVYIFELNQLYIGDENCKKLDEKFDDIIHIDIDYNWNMYSGRYEGEKAYYNKNIEMVSVDTLNYKILRKETNEKMEITSDLKEIRNSKYTRYRKTDPNTAFGIKGDNNIYMFKLSHSIDDNKSTISHEHIVYSVPEEEIILDFYFSTDADIYDRDFNIAYGNTGNIEVDIWKKYILTDKSYYRPMIINEECEKYLDVECKYEWRRDDELSKIRNDILYFDDVYLILSNGRVFYNSKIMP